MRMYVENIDESAHTADLRCGKQGCDYTAEGIDLLTHAQVKFAETVEGVTINGNVAGSVANSAALPAASGLAADTIYHVIYDDNNVVPDGGANLYRVVDNEGTKEWQQINAGITVTCPTCGLASTYPCFDPRNCVGASLGRAKTA